LKDKEKKIEKQNKEELESIHKLFDECQFELDDTLIQVMKYKTENINLIRKESKKMEKLKDKLKDIFSNN